MWFERRKVIRFHHCDPAAIIFYPQYFVLFHELMEEWFTEGLQTDYGEYVRNARLGVPAVTAACEFFAPSQLGDVVDFRLQPTRLGSSSLAFVGEATGKHQLRARAHITVVQMSLDTRQSVPFAAPLRARITTYLAPADPVDAPGPTAT